MLKNESFYLLHSPAEIIIIKDKVFDPNSGTLLFYQILNSFNTNRVCNHQDSIMDRIVRELYFIPNVNVNKKKNPSLLYKHKTNAYAALIRGDELIIFIKKENLFIFIKDHENKLDEIGENLDPELMLTDNITLIIKLGIVARDAHFGILPLSMIDKKSDKEIYSITKILN